MLNDLMSAPGRFDRVTADLTVQEEKIRTAMASLATVRPLSVGIASAR
jgi:hypothetical protein